ncbi:MAG: IPT/TIG domain-containing protein [Bryobacteraceae bacterium]|nr:IPT/TIG domain-containing protein [Bryobacteraceae bacterium]
MKTILHSCLLAAVAALSAWTQTINTVGGNSSWGDIQNIAVDGAGNLYAADVTRASVYKVDRLGVTTVVAGNGTPGYSGDGALATAAQLRLPAGVAIGPDGSIYVADYGNARIRRVAPNGIITTFAGAGVAGFTGDGGPATAARLNLPQSVIVDAAGNVYIADVGNYRVRRVNPAGVITTVAGSGRLCTQASGDGGPATSADSCPVWLALGPDGSLYFTDDGDLRFFGHARVRRVSPSGVITTVAGGSAVGFSGDGGPATSAVFRGVAGVGVDSGGNVFISDYLNARIRKVDPSGIVTTYAGTGTNGAGGDGGPAVRAQVNGPCGIVIDPEGNLYFADRVNVKIRKISPPPVPAIRTANPVVTSFLGNAGFSSNTYLEIYGSNFASTQRLWAGADFNGVNAPTSLDGISVLINGRPAYIYYISANQINVNTPEDTAAGAVSIQVRTPLGNSNTVTATRSRLSPTLQSVPQFLINGKQYVVALTPDFSRYIGNPGMLAGVAFVAAKPGDTISIYALGCGPTNPPTQAGVVAAQASAISSPFQIRIGGVPAPVTFAGMVAQSIGLYQFNVTVPFVAPGDQPIDLTVDGVPNNQNLFIVIGQ